MSTRAEINSETLDGEGYSVAAAEAERGDAALQITALQFIQKSYQDACAVRSNGMAVGVCAAVDVDFFAIEFQLPRDGDRSHGKGFVELNEIDVFVAVPAGFCQKFFDGIDRRHHYPFRFDAAHGLRDDASDGSFSQARRVAFAGDNQRGSTVVGSGGVSGSDCAIFFERGL